MIEQIKLKYYYLPYEVKRAAKLGLIIVISLSGMYFALKHQQNQPSVRELSPSMQRWQEEQARKNQNHAECYLKNSKAYCDDRYRY